MRRLFDILVSATALLVAAPLLLAAIVWIVIESPGSPFFRQLRVGRDGADFRLWKLRTMVKNAERIGAGLAVDRDDPRILRSGALLRRFSIDELPNLINVLTGDMSIVGPRPTVRAQVEQYDEQQRRRLEVKPGITGWAQVNGRASLPWAERIELDVWYVDHRSAALDAKILLRTVRLLFSGDDLYRGETGGWRD
jgi:lipopolysaccharide/colanic/teichoic acid biosynthesis glycosyltransferase